MAHCARDEDSILFFSDTHLGFDLPLHPRVDVRRRGPDFFKSFDRVLAYAVQERVDLVLHGGDLFFRSKVPPPIVDMVYARLVAFLDHGIPLGVIAGNHERSVLPSSLFLTHPRLHAFHHAGTHTWHVGGARVAVTGVPHLGGDATARLREVLRDAELPEADLRLLLLHQAVEGATVGPADFVFRHGEDVVRMDALPDRYDAYLCGHVHRRQVLWKPAADGRRRPAIYAGSTERTSFAEQHEEKGFTVIETGAAGRHLRFIRLPARPMLSVRLQGLHSDDDARRELSDALRPLPADAVVRLDSDLQSARWLTAALWRSTAPPTMSVQWGRVRAEAD